MVSRTTGFCTLALVLSASLAFASTKANGPATLSANDGAPTVAAQRQLGAPSLTSALNCPSNTLLNQPSVDPAGEWSFSTSELSPGYKMYDDFTCVVGSIESVHIVGLSLIFSGGFSDCTTEPAPSFLVEFWGAGPQPGALLASYTVTPTVTATGETFLGFPSYQYDMVLSPALTGVYSGWVSVQGQTAASGDCWLLWGNSLTTNGLAALQWDGTTFSDTGYDAALCIAGTPATLLGACCDEPSGLCLDDVNAIDCCGVGKRFLAGGSCDDFDPPCGQQPGACCYDDATCALVPQQLCRTKTPGDMDCDGDVDFFDIDPWVLALSGDTAYYAQFPLCNRMNGDCDLDGDVDFFDIDPFVALLGTPPVSYPATFLGVGTTCDQCPCAIFCPPGSTPEGEACGADTNGGCNMPVPAFEPIACGQTICGTMYSTTALRDTDWYILTLTSPAILNISLLAEMDAVTGLIEPVCYGGAFSCDNITGFIEPFLQVFGCAGGSVTTECLPAGEYVIFVAPAVFGDFACEKDYNLRVTCEPCTLPVGACCFFPSGACTDGLNVYECVCVGGEWQGADTLCANVVCPTPPANDLCAGAEFLDLAAGPQLFTINNQYATDDGTPTCGTSAPYKGLWYKVTGADQKIFLSTCNAGTTHPDTKIQVFCGCDYQCVTGKDDDSSACSINSFLTTVEWCGKAGIDYYILIGSYGSTQVGDIQVAVGYTGEVCTPTFAESCIPCVVECPSGGIAELEVCGEDTNGGCNYDVPPYLFETIECGQTICGTSWYNTVVSGFRDTDWYRLNITSPQILTVTANAEFDVLVGLILPPCPATAFAYSDTGANCEPSGFTTQCLAPGEYWIFIAPQFTASESCPSDYTLTVTCEPCVIQQGDTCADPLIIPSLPFTTLGDTTNFTDNYNAVCPYTATGARDVVYSYTTGATPVAVNITLCRDATNYDSKIYVFEGDCATAALYCNDDACSTLSYPSAYVSRLDCVALAANTTYYIVIDGYSSSDYGVYDLLVEACSSASYCTAGATCDEFIAGVDVPGVLTNLGTACGAGGYTDYTAISGNMQVGQSYNITVNIGPPNYSGDQAAVWVDWNQSVSFDAGELTTLVVDPSYDFATGTITVPASALQGNTRMRVRVTWTGAIPPCGTTSYGETEDYTINVVP